MGKESPIQIYGLAEVRKAFKQADKVAGPKELKAAYASVSKLVATMSQAEARSGTPLQAKMAKAIKPKTSVVRGAGVVVTSNFEKGASRRTKTDKATGQKTVTEFAARKDSGATMAAAFTAFWGIDRPIGWYASFPGATGAKQNLPAWVGNTWKDDWLAGRFSEGPYAIRDAVRKNIPEIEQQFLEAIAEAYRKVGFYVQ